MGLLKKAAVALGVGAIGALTGGLSAAYLGLKVKASALLGGASGVLAVLTNRGAPVGAERSPTILRSKLAPAQWVVGRARAEGRLVFGMIRQSTLHLAVLLSEGRCDGIESIFLDDVEIGLAESGNGYRAAAAVNGVLDSSVPVTKITPYFAADGSGGESLRSVSPAGGGWGSKDRLVGKSWAHIELNQWVGGRSVFEKVPKIEVLMRGQVFPWPGQPTPQWTESAAPIRWWWETRRKGIPPDEFDFMSVIQAHGICSDVLHYELPENMRSTYGIDGGAFQESIRYAVNGIIFSDDPPDAVDRQLDLAWGGAIANDGGLRRFLPGFPRAPDRDITGADITAFEGWIAGSSPAAYTTAVRMNLAASRYHGHAPLSMPAAVGTLIPGRLRYKEIDAGTSAFISDPLQAGRVQGILLRTAQNSGRWQYRLAPGRAMENLHLRPGDVARVFDDSNDLRGEPMVIESAEILEDWTVSVSFSRQIDWSPTFVGAPLNTGTISAGGTGQPPHSERDGALDIVSGGGI